MHSGRRLSFFRVVHNGHPALHFVSEREGKTLVISVPLAELHIVAAAVDKMLSEAPTEKTSGPVFRTRPRGRTSP
jgi:hypothetical protein